MIKALARLRKKKSGMTNGRSRKKERCHADRNVCGENQIPETRLVGLTLPWHSHRLCPWPHAGGMASTNAGNVNRFMAGGRKLIDYYILEPPATRRNHPRYSRKPRSCLPENRQKGEILEPILSRFSKISVIFYASARKFPPELFFFLHLNSAHRARIDSLLAITRCTFVGTDYGRFFILNFKNFRTKVCANSATDA